MRILVSNLFFLKKEFPKLVLNNCNKAYINGSEKGNYNRINIIIHTSQFAAIETSQSFKAIVLSFYFLCI